MLQGKKTYLMLGLTVLYVAAGWMTGHLETQRAIEILLGTGVFGGLRAAVGGGARCLAPVAFCMVIASQASAETHLAAGWGANRIAAHGKQQDVSDLLLRGEIQKSVGAMWLGLNVGGTVAEDGAAAEVGQSKALSIRAYFDDGAGDTYPGFGITAFDWQTEQVGILVEDTIMMGPELLVETTVPETFFLLPGQPILAYIGAYWPILGDSDANQVGFGLDILIGAEKEPGS